MSKTTSFAGDTRPLFTDRDIQGMKKGFNLASYDEVKHTHRPSTTEFEELVARLCRHHLH